MSVRTATESCRQVNGLEHFWLWIVLLGGVLFAVSRFLPKPSVQSAKVVQEIEESMELFASEIEEENKELTDLIARMKRDHERQVDELQRKIATLEERSQETAAELKRLLAAGAVPAVAAAAGAFTAPGPAEQPAEPAEQSAGQPAEVQPAVSLRLRERHAQLFELYGQGKSVESIAKKLGMNKGEVSLIIHLAKQEEAANRE